METIITAFYFSFLFVLFSNFILKASAFKVFVKTFISIYYFFFHFTLVFQVS